MKHHTRPTDMPDTPTSKRRIRQSCCWPDCEKPSFEEAPLCGAHINIAHGMQVRIWSGEAALYRATIVVDRRDEPAPPKPEATEGTIYYVQVGAHVKIGWTANMESRMRKYPPNSTLLAQHPGTRKDEARTHRRFAADRTHGREWYVPSASLSRHINEMVRVHGQPDVVTFGAKPVHIPMPHRLASPMNTKNLAHPM